MDSPLPTPRPRLLFVDDDPSVRRAVHRALSAQWDVTTCASGAEVIETLERGGRFDVILSDHRMPILSGPQLYALVIAGWPDQASRFAFLSATPIDPSNEASLRPFLEKPFDVHDVRAFAATLLTRWGRSA